MPEFTYIYLQTFYAGLKLASPLLVLLALLDIAAGNLSWPARIMGAV